MRIPKNLYFKSDNSKHVKALNFLNKIRRHQADFVSELICDYIEFWGLKDELMSEDEVTKQIEYRKDMSSTIERNELVIKQIDFDNLTLKQCEKILEKISLSEMLSYINKPIHNSVVGREFFSNNEQGDELIPEVRLDDTFAGEAKKEDRTQPTDTTNVDDMTDDTNVDDIQVDETLLSNIDIFY